MRLIRMCRLGYVNCIAYFLYFFTFFFITVQKSGVYRPQPFATCALCMDLFDFSQSVRRRIQAAALRVLFRSSKKCNKEGESIQKQLEDEDRRLNLRINMEHMPVYVTDGCFLTPAMITNISPSGICLCNLPEHIFWRTEHLFVYSSSNHTIPVLHVLPVWELITTEGKMIGAMILNTSKSWHIFYNNALENIEK